MTRGRGGLCVLVSSTQSVAKGGLELVILLPLLPGLQVCAVSPGLSGARIEPRVYASTSGGATSPSLSSQLYHGLTVRFVERHKKLPLESLFCWADVVVHTHKPNVIRFSRGLRFSSQHPCGD